MAVEASGTQAATVTTEHTLATVTGEKKLVLIVDTLNMVDAATPDILELRVKQKVLTGDTEQIVYCVSYIGKQGDASNGQLHKVSIPIASPFSAIFTLKQTQGAAGRNFKWSVISL